MLYTSAAWRSWFQEPHEARRSLIEKCLEDTAEGRVRQERAITRRDDQLTRELDCQDRLISGTSIVEVKGEAAIA